MFVRHFVEGEFDTWNDFVYDGIAAEDCHKRWKSLRDRFGKENKKLPSGSGNDSGAVKWKYFDSLLFLQGFNIPNQWDFEIVNLNYNVIRSILFFLNLNSGILCHRTIDNIGTSESAENSRHAPGTEEIENVSCEGTVEKCWM